MKIDLTDRRNIYFVGDLHGDFKALQFALKELGFTYRDAIVSVGDLIDRGDYNLETLMFFMYTENAYAVRGNHEDMAIQGCVYGMRDQYHIWMMNGGAWALEYPTGMINGLLTELDKKLPIAIEVQVENFKIGVCHAELPTDDWYTFYTQVDNYNGWFQKAIWGRRRIKEDYREIPDVHAVIHGHSVNPEVVIKGNQLWIDTGSVFDSGSSKYGLTILKFDRTNGEFEQYRISRDSGEVSGFIIE